MTEKNHEAIEPKKPRKGKNKPEEVPSEMVEDTGLTLEEEAGTEKSKGDRNIKRTAILAGSIVVAVVAVLVVAFGVFIYGYKSENPVVRMAAAVIPYPVERVNGTFVSYNDFLFEVDANVKAYQGDAKLNNKPQVDFKSADGKKLMQQIEQHVLDKLKVDAVTAQLARQKKVTVTDKEVNALLDQMYQRYGGKDTLMKTLAQVYGWNLADLKKVVRKQLLTQDLQTKVTGDPALEAPAKAKAKDIVDKIKAGGDFGDLAKKYSQASDAATGGDLGSFAKGDMPDEVQKAAEALQPGQVSDPVKTQYGFEILKVLEKKDDGTIHAQHILIKTVDFNQWLQEQTDKAKTQTYIKV